jgi:hypothetical protein
MKLFAMAWSLFGMVGRLKQLKIPFADQQGQEGFDVQAHCTRKNKQQGASREVISQRSGMKRGCL